MLFLLLPPPFMLRGSQQERYVLQTIRMHEKEETELISPFLLMLLTRQVHIPWTAAFLHIDLQSLLDRLNAWNSIEHALQFSESGTIASFVEPNINAFAQLLRTEYDRWHAPGEAGKLQPVSSPAVASVAIKDFKRLDQLLAFIHVALAGEARIPLKDIAEFLGIEEDVLIIQINRMSQIRIEGKNMIIPLILWEDIPQGNDGLLGRDHFIATLDAKFAQWGYEAKKKSE